MRLEVQAGCAVVGLGAGFYGDEVGYSRALRVDFAPYHCRCDSYVLDCLTSALTSACRSGKEFRTRFI